MKYFIAALASATPMNYNQYGQNDYSQNNYGQYNPGQSGLQTDYTVNEYTDNNSNVNPQGWIDDLGDAIRSVGDFIKPIVPVVKDVIEIITTGKPTHLSNSFTTISQVQGKSMDNSDTYTSYDSNQNIVTYDAYGNYYGK